MPRESELNLDFESWLSSAGVVFSTLLTGEQKLKFLSHVIGLCSATEVNEFLSGLKELHYRDFITLLPAELSHVLLFFFDVKTLLTACQVCRSWNRTISGNRLLWRKRAMQRGFRLPEEEQDADALPYKQMFTQNSLVRWWQRSCDVVNLDGHTERVMAVYYHNGKIATGSDDQTVRMWCAQTGQCLSIFTTHTVSAIKFDDSFLVTASCDRTAASWDVRTGDQLRRYTGHVAAVLCVDFDLQLDILATGSADGTVKLWSFSKGDLLRTLERLDNDEGLHGVWVLNVRLFCYGNQRHRFNVLASYNNCVFTYAMDASTTAVRTSEILFDLGTNHRRLIGWDVSGSFLNIASIVDLTTDYPASLAIKETSYEFSESAGGRFVIGKSIVFPLWKPMHIYSYLGNGKCFSAFISVCDKKATLHVARRTGEIPPVMIEIESVFRPTRAEINKIVTLCNREWMDGISSDIFGQTILAAVFSNNSIRTLKLDSKEKGLS